MSSDEAKAIVAEGLEHKRAERNHREQEAKLDNYEMDMMATISEKSAAVKENERKRQNREKLRAMAAARRQEQARKAAEAEEVVKRYAIICLLIMMLATWTPIPWYGAAALICGLAAITAAHIFRLYYPI